jgi:SAM-dependent methyltransferase
MRASIQPHNEPVAARWSTGGREYERISAQIADSIEHCVLRLAPRPGERFLDLATGTGWTARRLHQRGATVVGVDIASGLLDAARQISPGDVDFQMGDAEALPCRDGEFDGVASTCGIMFASRPEAAAAEVARALRKGGRFATTCWTPDSTVAAMFKIIRAYMPPPPDPSKAPPSPFEWGRPERVRELLGAAFDLRFEKATSFYRDTDPQAAWQAFVAGYGPVKALAESLPADRRSALEAEFVALHRQYATDLGIQVPREYYLVYGVRK